MPNGIDLVLADHQLVNELFDRFDSDRTGATVGLIVAALMAHDDAEQAALYPIVGTLLGDLDVVERAEAAHSLVKKQLDQMASLEGEALVAAAQVLRELVTEHVADEEQNILPALAGVATPQQLDAFGARFLQAKQRGG